MRERRLDYALGTDGVERRIGARRVVKLFFDTTAGRNFLLAASDLQPGSGAMSRLWDQFAARLPRLIATEAAAPQGPGR